VKRTEQHVVEISHAAECPCRGPEGSHPGEVAPPFRTVRKWSMVKVEVPDPVKEE